MSATVPHACFHSFPPDSIWEAACHNVFIFSSFTRATTCPLQVETTEVKGGRDFERDEVMFPILIK